jgi:hypothetical protein
MIKAWLLTLATLMGLRSLFMEPCTKTSHIDATGLEAYAAGGSSYIYEYGVNWDKSCKGVGDEQLTLHKLDAPGYTTGAWGNPERSFRNYYVKDRLFSQFPRPVNRISSTDRLPSSCPSRIIHRSPRFQPFGRSAREI